MAKRVNPKRPAPKKSKKPSTPRGAKRFGPIRRFTTLDLTKVTRRALRDAFEVDGVLKRVYLTFRWTEGREIAVGFVRLQTGPTTWLNLIDHPVTDTDGSGTLSLGDFPAGATITVKFACRAIDPIPHAAALAWQQEPEHYEKVSPTDEDTIALVANGPWNATFQYQVQ